MVIRLLTCLSFLTLASCRSPTCAHSSDDNPSCVENAPVDVVEAGCAGPITPSNLLGPVGEQFERVYWQKRPVLIRRNCTSTFNAIHADDLAQMFPDVMAEGEEHGQMQLSSFRKGDEYVRIINFYANIFLGYLDGASIVFNQFDTLWPHAAQFSQLLTKAFPSLFKREAPPAMNLYMTPPGGNQIFPLHNDEQDVMIMQLSGSKVWRVQYEPSKRYKGILKLGTDEPNVPALRAILRPGDLLYIPRHHKHEGYTDNTSHSLSISLTNPFAGSEHDIQQAKLIKEHQTERLKQHPLPRGRIGPLHMQSMLSRGAEMDKLSREKLRMKDWGYLRKMIKSRIQAKSSAEHHARSTSHRVLQSLAEAVVVLHNGTLRSSMTCSNLPSAAGDTLGKTSLAVVMNWLQFARWS